MTKFLTRLEKSKDFWFVLFTLFGFFLLRLPSLFEPYWYGDEGIYEVIGFGLRHGRFLYTGIWDNKPPMLYLVYALFNGDQGPAKFLSLLFGLLAVVTFFFLSKKLFQERKIIWTTTLIFAFLFATPMLEGNIANAENFMLLPILLAALYIVSYLQKTHHQQLTINDFKPFIISGLLLGFAFLFKVVAVFDLGAFALFACFILLRDAKSFIHTIFKLVVFGVSFALPLLLTAGFFAVHGLFHEFIQSAFLSNVGYVNYGNQFIIPQGLLILKLLLLAGVCIVLSAKRNNLSHAYLFTILWLAFSLFNALFSQRPYTHYLLVLLASLSLVVGVIMTITHEKLQKLYIVGFLGLILFITNNFWIYTKTIPYYGNFLSFVIGHENATSYRAFFDNAAVLDYDIVTFFNKNKKTGDTLFVWGNDGQIYKLSDTLPPGRYIVAYWMANNSQTQKETALALAKNPPRFIAILKGQPPIPISLANYSEIVMLQGAVIYARNN